MKLYAGIEAGGTNFVCALGSGPDDILAQTVFDTGEPGSTIDQALDFFEHQSQQYGSIAAIGVASFGPLDPQPNSPNFGHITSTPKLGWSNFDFVGAVREVFDLPIGFDTDVNGAALAEWRWGNARELDTFIYLTIGTGIGGGGLVNGQLMHGMIHPEMGHIPIPHDWDRDPFEGICPFHADCLEGLANGPSLEARWAQSPKTLPPDHPAWDLEAHYLALGLVAFICALSPQRIIMGGGVMEQEQLFPLIRAKVRRNLNGYVQSPQVLDEIDSYIVPPKLGDRAGVMGAIALAAQALGKFEEIGR